jgi:hypothetical protein
VGTHMAMRTTSSPPLHMGNNSTLQCHHAPPCTVVAPAPAATHALAMPPWARTTTIVALPPTHTPGVVANKRGE